LLLDMVNNHLEKNVCNSQEKSLHAFANTNREFIKSKISNFLALAYCGKEFSQVRGYLF